MVTRPLPTVQAATAAPTGSRSGGTRASPVPGGRVLPSSVTGSPEPGEPIVPPSADPGDHSSRRTATTFIVRLFINAVAIWFATLVVPGFEVVPEGRASTTVLTTLGVALVFGLVNAVIRPIVAFLSLPLYLLTLGLFTLVVNGLMLALTAWITELTDYGVRIDDFWAALLGAFIISVVSFLLSYFVLSSIERRQTTHPTPGVTAG